jgi:hypothetical protein
MLSDRRVRVEARARVSARIPPAHKRLNREQNFSLFDEFEFKQTVCKIYTGCVNRRLRVIRINVSANQRRAESQKRMQDL